MQVCGGLSYFEACCNRFGSLKQAGGFSVCLLVSVMCYRQDVTVWRQALYYILGRHEA